MMQFMKTERPLSNVPRFESSEQFDAEVELIAIEAGTISLRGNITSRVGGVITVRRHNEELDELAKEPLKPIHLPE